MNTPKNPTLHIVEDDAAVREALALVLQDDGYTVQPWPDGEGFLAEAKIRDRDVVLLDLSLPGLSGTQVAARLKARGTHPRTVVLSGMRGGAFDRAVAAIEPMAALRKPIAPHRLRQVLLKLAS